jgi:hypothetical protein
VEVVVVLDDVLDDLLDDLPDDLVDDGAEVVEVVASSASVVVTEVAPSLAVGLVAWEVRPWEATRVPVIPAKAATLAAAVTRRARAAAWRRGARRPRGLVGSGSVVMEAVCRTKVRRR